MTWNRHSCLCLLLIALALLLSCNRESRKQIAVIPKGQAHLFWQSVHAGAVAAARETGVDIVWDGPPAETDFTGQLQITATMITRPVAAICLAPIDKTAMVSVLYRAAREKIQIGRASCRGRR